MSEAPQEIQLPEEVLAFLRDVPAQPFCPLTPEGAARRSAKLQNRHPLARELGLVRLNKTNDDFYAYVTRGPAAGAVLFLPHDDGLSFAFPSLTALGEALRSAAAAGTELEDLEPVVAAPVADQAAVRARVRSALAQRDGDAANALAAYLPLVAHDDVETLGLAAADRDFLVREVAAKRMAAAPNAAQVPLLEALCGDRHSQVWRHARAALAVLGVEGPPLSEEQAYEIDTGERGTTGVVISLVTRNSGQGALVMDDARRAGAAPPYQWNSEGYAGKERFDLEELLEHEVDRSALAALGRSIVARLALHHKTGGKPRG